MKRKAHSYREKGEKHTNVAKEFFKSATINLFIHEPIAHKENYGTHHEETHEVKVES